jgi:hypothetical protein
MATVRCNDLPVLEGDADAPRVDREDEKLFAEAALLFRRRLTLRAE